jgi:hypothetical protein
MAAGADHVIEGVMGVDNELSPLLQPFNSKTGKISPIKKRMQDFI